MKNIDFIQLNKFSKLHNNYDIFFCKTDYILQDYEYISKLDHEVVFITGNSDYPIVDQLVDKAPKNIKKWYCQNALSNNEIIYPIPIGIENKFESYRPNHGICYEQRVNEKENIIKNIQKKLATKFIYANFNIETNISYRKSLLNKIYDISYITYKNPTLSLIEFFNDILDHKMVLCPIGNGIDTHRIWEVLYCDRIPITFKVGNYKIYELYQKFPILILNNFEELLDENLIKTKYNEIISKNYDKDMLNYSYWEKNV